jgi:hypothetical protein
VRFRWRHGRLQYVIGRTWRRSRFLGICCHLGLHFMALDFQRDGAFCECGREALTGEQTRGTLWRRPTNP